MIRKELKKESVCLLKKVNDRLMVKGEPFSTVMKLGYDYNRVQQKAYDDIKPTLSDLFEFCKISNVTKENTFTSKNMEIFVDNDYLYLINNGSAFSLFTISEFCQFKVRIKNKSKRNDYIYEYYFKPNLHTTTKEETELKYEIVDFKQKQDSNFNYMMFETIYYVVDLIVNTEQPY